MDKIIFIGTASENLGKALAKKFGFKIGEKEVVRFGNSEIKVTVKQPVFGKRVWVIQSTSNPTDSNLMELLLTIDALRRSGAEKINCIIPYFGYARQNIQHREGECVSAHMIIKILETVGATRVIAVDLHDEGTAGIFSIPFVHLSVFPLMARYVRESIGVENGGEENFVVGSPDQGGVERARLFANYFYEKKDVETIVVEKKRNLDKIHTSKAIELFGNVKDKSVILVDDIATSGSTLINAANLCYSGGAKKIYAVIAHSDFAIGTAEKLNNSLIEKIFTTNTIEKTVEPLERFNKIKVLDISEIFEKVLVF